MRRGGIAEFRNGVSATDGTGSLDRETVFDILSNRRRRYVLHFLKGHEGAVGLRELSEHIAAWENDCRPEAVTSKERKRVYAALHQSHLPKMDRSGVIRYDSDRGVIELTDAIADIDVYLELVPRSELDWGEFYLGLGALGTLVATLVAFDVFPFRLLSPIAYLFLFALVALAVGAAHTYRRRRARVEGGIPPGVDPVSPPDAD